MPAVHCNVCKKFISVTKAVKCASFACNAYAHPSCLTGGSKSAPQFLCLRCKPCYSPLPSSEGTDHSADKITTHTRLSAQTNMDKSTASSSTSTSAQLTSLTALVKDVMDELKSQRTDLRELPIIKGIVSELTVTTQDMATSVQQLALDISAMSTRCSSLEAANLSLVARCQTLEEHNTALVQRVDSLEERLSRDPELSSDDGTALKAQVEHLMQRNLDTQIVVTGLLSAPDVTVERTIELLARSLGIVTKSGDVVDAFRLPPKAGGAPPLIIRFATIFIRDSWIAQKKKKPVLLASDIDASLPGSRVYLNERLSSVKHKLLVDTRAYVKPHRHLRVWTRHGSIYVRKDGATTSLKIEHRDDFAKIPI
ncbi:uncharacterized protein LOC107274133 [Cephus cinctus]|uniref:Uncharacterized protein LOC107274133 n=1 Tax=Cephus cinctus TaxID=211228 RepID=A0AAJ7CES3_CEPCN|nr:uncharacterized protein LOC107274133 [Cephus cinctus]